MESLSEDKIKDYKLMDEKKLSSVKKYVKERYLNELLKMVGLIPSDRIEAKSVISILKSVNGELRESFQK